VIVDATVQQKAIAHPSDSRKLMVTPFKNRQRESETVMLGVGNLTFHDRS
jgi:hypothetical protein